MHCHSYSEIRFYFLEIKGFNEWFNNCNFVLGTSRQLAKFKKYKNKWKDLEKEFMISAVKKLNVEEVEIKEKSHHDPTLEETCKPRALCLGEVLVPPSWRLSRSSSGSLCDTCSVST